MEVKNKKNCLRNLADLGAFDPSLTMFMLPRRVNSGFDHFAFDMYYYYSYCTAIPFPPWYKLIEGFLRTFILQELGTHVIFNY